MPNQAPIAANLLPMGFAVASASLAANSLVYVKADGTLALADATAQGKEAMAYITAAIANGQTGPYYGAGVMSGLSGLTPGAPAYMDTTPGAVTSTAPSTTGNVVLKVGVAMTASTVLFKPEMSVTL